LDWSRRLSLLFLGILGVMVVFVRLSQRFDGLFLVGSLILAIFYLCNVYELITTSSILFSISISSSTHSSSSISSREMSYQVIHKPN